MGALGDAGYKTSTKKFKLPVAGQYWIKRFRDTGVPRKNEAVFWNGGPARDVANNNIATPVQRWAKGIEFNGFEARLQAKGVLLYKMQIFIRPSKLCKYFGKRLAREVIATKIASENKKELSEKEAADLDKFANHQIDKDDYLSFTNY